MVFANISSGIVHYKFCNFHPSDDNLVIYEELYQALADGYTECRICYGIGFLIDREICNQCNIDFSLWENGCEYLRWENDQAYCYKLNEA